MKDGILIGIVIALLVILGIGWNQYSKLETKFQQFQIENTIYKSQIDSLSQINKNQSYIIDSISLNITNLQNDINKVYKDKQELEDQLDKFQFTSSLDDNVILLRDNIWKYSH